MPSTSRLPIAKNARKRQKGLAAVGIGIVVTATIFAFGLRTSDSVETVTHTVLIEAMRFRPSRLNVRVGDRVEFENTDFVPNTATSVAGPSFDSGVLQADQAWSFTCEQRATFPIAARFIP